MVGPGRYAKSAAHLKAKIEAAFVSVSYAEVTEALRMAGDQRSTRQRRSALESALSDLGVRAYPPLGTPESETQSYRLFHHETVVASLVDLLKTPGEESDKKLAEVVTKVKGLWDWAR